MTLCLQAQLKSVWSAVLGPEMQKASVMLSFIFSPADQLLVQF